MNVAIHTSGLTKHFGRRLALDRVSLSIQAGQVHAVIGSNGAGKSTLFRLLLGFETPTSGWSRVLGEISDRLRPVTRGRIAWVQEDHALPTWMKVQDLIAIAREQHPAFNANRFNEIGERFSFSTVQRVSKLSRGERAGLDLALALAKEPELLILDEPTLGLDVVAKQIFQDALIDATGDAHRTVLYCSHQMDEIERLADSIIVLDRGRVRAADDLDRFRARVSAWIAEFRSPPRLEEIEGLLGVRVIEGAHHLYVLDAPKAFIGQLDQMGAAYAEACDLTFEGAVSAILIGGTRHMEEAS